VLLARFHKRFPEFSCGAGTHVDLIGQLTREADAIESNVVFEKFPFAHA
jgi:hypothetical protein